MQVQMNRHGSQSAAGVPPTVRHNSFHSSFHNSLHHSFHHSFHHCFHNSCNHSFHSSFHNSCHNSRTVWSETEIQGARPCARLHAILKEGVTAT